MAAKTFPNTQTNTTHLQTPARRILGEMFPNKSKNGDRSVASPVIELDSTNDRRDARLPLASFRETPEEELARDRRTLKRIAIGSLAAGGVVATKGIRPLICPARPIRSRKAIRLTSPPNGVTGFEVEASWTCRSDHGTHGVISMSWLTP